MNRVKLGDVCEIISGATPKRERDEYWGGSIPWVTPKELSDLESPYLDDSVEKITEMGYKSCSSRMLPAGSLLFSSRAPIGSIAINRIPVCTNQGFKSFIPADSVDVHYLYYCIKKHVPALQARGNGATFKELPKSSVEEFEIPLPPLDDQKRIAHLLGKVEGLIAQRKQHLQQLDALLKSVFLEMFGDPVKNEKGWAVCNIADVCDQIVDCVNKTAQESEIPTQFIMIRTSNIRHGRISLEKIKFVDEATYKIWTRRSVPQRGDILFTREAPMGEAAMVAGDDKIFLGQRIMQYRFNCASMNPIFALHQMQSLYFLRQIERLGKGSTVKHLAVPDCFKFKVFKPAIELQNKFATIVEKVEGIKTGYQQSLADLEALYGALSQKAFAGELDLSRVRLPAMEATPVMPHQVIENMTETVKMFVVPQIPEGANLGDRMQRQTLIQEWLQAYWEQIPVGQNLTVCDFVDAVNAVLQSQEDVPAWGVADQDLIREWLFSALENSQIEQTTTSRADNEWVRHVSLKKSR